MNIRRSLIRSLTGDDSELVLHFFVTFSRFEYALKRAGFVKGNGKYDNASPDWNRFARERCKAQIDSIEDVEFKKARSFLLNTPPKIQVVTDHRVRQTYAVEEKYKARH